MFTYCSSDSASGKLMWTRREMVALTLAGAASLPSQLGAAELSQAEATGRLQARPGGLHQPVASWPQGLSSLGLDERRDALLYVPANISTDRPSPLIVMLHGAGHKATDVVEPWSAAAEKHGFLLLAPTSRGITWNINSAPACADADFIDRALALVLARAAVDPRHLALAGFSDGATFALSLGLPNGDLFSHVMCFSLGGIHAQKGIGKPRVFFSHGRHDEVLSIAISRQLAGRLTDLGYDVTFEEFSGGHRIPPEVKETAFQWFLSEETLHG
jgi:phospholipase/carboxylesterase